MTPEEHVFKKFFSYSNLAFFTTPHTLIPSMPSLPGMPDGPWNENGRLRALTYNLNILFSYFVWRFLSTSKPEIGEQSALNAT